jgi:hypothetical protein
VELIFDEQKTENSHSEIGSEIKIPSDAGVSFGTDNH